LATNATLLEISELSEGNPAKISRASFVRLADALSDRTGVGIAIVDLPAFLSVLFGSAAGEGGHAPITAHAGSAGKSSYGLGLESSKATAARGSQDRAL
jgi:hypothetical protein